MLMPRRNAVRPIPSATPQPFEERRCRPGGIAIEAEVTLKHGALTKRILFETVRAGVVLDSTPAEPSIWVDPVAIVPNDKLVEEHATVRTAISRSSTDYDTRIAAPKPSR